MASKYFYRLTRVGSGLDAAGFAVLNYALCEWVGTSTFRTIDKVKVRSGLFGAQFFRTGKNSEAGSGEPIPEGEFDMGPIEWAGPVGNYAKSWKTGIGATWRSLEPKFQTARSALGQHRDLSTPGTLGCVGLQSEADERKCVEWETKYPTRELHVDWGLGTAKKMTEVTDAPAPTPANPPAGYLPLKGRSIALEAGHGKDSDGFEQGMSAYGYQEWEVNKAACKALKPMLEKLGMEVHLYIYDKDGEAPTLREKGEKAIGRDIYLCVHHNALDGTGPLDASYTTALVDKSRVTPADERFAKIMAYEISRVVGIPVGEIQKRSLGVFGGRLESWKSTRACCLTEGFFMDANEMRNKDLIALATKEAEGLCAGVLRYCSEAGLLAPHTLPLPEPTPTVPVPVPADPKKWIAPVIALLEQAIAVLKKV
jgi:N-acetylmuramoyl-L-alanine amidase